MIEVHGEDAKLYFDTNYHHQYDESPSPSFFVYANKIEMDDEYKARISKEEKQKQDQLEREQHPYTALKKKFAK